MNIGIVGAGIAGLAAARVLSRNHSVTLFEANGYAGGHTNTIDVLEGTRQIPIDTGFIVFNEPNYPNLCKLFRTLGVEYRDSNMSFSVRCDQSGIEYNGRNLGALFAQRRNLLRPSHWKMLSDILKFHKEAPEHLRAQLPDLVTVKAYLERYGYGDAFINRYLLPLGASLWSCSMRRFAKFPMRFVIEFLQNHHMLQVEGRPVWKTVCGGSREYVRKLLGELDASIRLNTPVATVRRRGGRIELALEDGRVESFDEAIMACHADQSLRLIADADALERSVLERFPYQPNDAVLHTDTSLLPSLPKTWASWNYRVPEKAEETVSVTYHMNMLQGLESRQTYLVSLNPGSSIDQSRIIRRIRYEHPLFVPGRASAQNHHADLIRRRGISYCGAYWGFGFHEDGVRSALNVCAAFDQDLERAA